MPQERESTAAAPAAIAVAVGCSSWPCKEVCSAKSCFGGCVDIHEAGFDDGPPFEYYCDHLAEQVAFDGHYTAAVVGALWWHLGTRESVLVLLLHLASTI